MNDETEREWARIKAQLYDENKNRDKYCLVQEKNCVPGFKTENFLHNSKLPCYMNKSTLIASFLL